MTGLVPYDEIRSELEAADSIDVLGEAKARLDAATTYARRLKMRPAVLDGVELTRRCERRIGQVLAMTVKAGNPILTEEENCLPPGISHNQSSQWQAIGRLTDERFEEILAERRAADEEAYLTFLLTGAKLVASDENEWYTPAKYSGSARAVMGGIDLDPASSDAANETIGATNYFTAEADGLEQPWAGRVWLNPPYGSLAARFVTRLLAVYGAGDVQAAVVLINAHCTDTEWFQGLWDHPLCFTDHRIDFTAAGRDKTSTSTHGSVFAYLGPDQVGFKDEFAKYGPIVRRA